MRNCILRKLQIAHKQQQNGKHKISTTARPHATPFDRGQPVMLNSHRKNTRVAFSLMKQLKCATPLGRPPDFRPGCASQPHVTTTRDNWSSGMSYGGGGVAKGGYDCRYRCVEEDAYRRNCKSHTNAQQNARHYISRTTRPLAKLFDGGRREMLDSPQKNTPGAFSQWKQSKYATPSVARLIFGVGAPVSSTSPLRALIGVPG